MMHITYKEQKKSIEIYLNITLMNCLKNSIILLFLFLLINGSCKNSSRKDLSLTVDEYKKLGMPDHTKIWTNDEYINANITLSSIKTHYPLSLPRKNSKNSGEIFTRIIKEENLSFVNDTTLPLIIRASLVQFFPVFLSQLKQIYTSDLNEEQYYREELIDIDIFGLFIYKRMFELAGKIMNSNDKSDQSIQSGLSTVKYNYLNMIESLLADQVKTVDFTTRDLDRLSLEVTKSLAENIEWISPEDKKNLETKVKNTFQESTSSMIRQNYKKALEILKDSTINH